ncbi:MAG: hypothetical protein AAB444_03840 [Patescibacteria group bacterium]
MSTASDRAILGTLAFYDLFEYPLTLLELWQKLPGKQGEGFRNAVEMERCIEGSPFLKERIEKDGAFYFLRGRSHILSLRARHFRESLRKMKLARRVSRWISLVPFVKGVAVCNSLGYGNAARESDIDFFILVERGRLWVTRAIAVMLTEIVASRPSSEKSKDGICLSFFAAEGKNFLHLRLPGGDPYFDWWMTGIVPLYERGDAFKQWWDGNRWVQSERPNASIGKTAFGLRVHVSVTVLSFALKRIFGWSFVERLARFFEWRHLSRAVKDRANISTEIVLQDDILKFHTSDARAEYRRRWEKRLAGLGV